MGDSLIIVIKPEVKKFEAQLSVWEIKRYLINYRR